jgi:hypothetical protein
MANWARGGYIDVAKKAAEMKKSHKRRLFRFWMDLNTKAIVTFLDDDTKTHKFLHMGEEFNLDLPFTIDEHSYFANGSYFNNATCSGEGCRFCAEGNYPQEVAIYSIINHTPRTSKKDSSKIYKDDIFLYVVKTGLPIYAQLQENSTLRGGLRGVRFQISRDGTKKELAANVGTSVMFIEKTSTWDTMLSGGKWEPLKDEEGKIKALPEIPNYMDLFAPKDSAPSSELPPDAPKEEKALPF